MEDSAVKRNQGVEMKLTVLAGTAACGDGSCPTAYDTETETDRVIIQGYEPGGTRPTTISGQQSVEVPTELVDNTRKRLTADGRIPTGRSTGIGSVFATDRGTLVLTGLEVTDSDARDQLNLPEGERAIESTRPSCARKCFNCACSKSGHH